MKLWKKPAGIAGIVIGCALLTMGCEAEKTSDPLTKTGDGWKGGKLGGTKADWLEQCQVTIDRLASECNASFDDASSYNIRTANDCGENEEAAAEAACAESAACTAFSWSGTGEKPDGYAELEACINRVWAAYDAAGGSGGAGGTD
jgi:hypothetical protein